MLTPIDSWFLDHPEPVCSCLQYMREHILARKDVSETWQYGMPFYRYKGKRFCYLWFHKKYKQPYIGFVDGKLLEHADLLAEERSRMKIFLLDAEKTIPVKKINVLLKAATDLHN
ncbi:MAG: hypothetical protein K0S33_3909 [Bacteroidetes bacterium]|jgi:hypothetical protein|nr:hypothetical protein [Bacteroidota bacterium]